MRGVSEGIEEILNQILEGRRPNRDQLLRLMECDVLSDEMYALMATANRLTRQSFNNMGEVHAQVGVNYAPCPKKCKFCVFGSAVKSMEFTVEEVVRRARAFEKEGANAIFLMTTADYDFDKFLLLGNAVRRAIHPHMPLVANIGNFGHKEANDLLDAGFTAIYHVCRLREGIDTCIDPKDRLSTIKAAKSLGLDLSYCIEPIGPEHTHEELVEAILLGRELKPTIMATMRRIAVGDTPLSRLGQISELELAKIEAITRLAVGPDILAMGVHEVNVPSLLAGANQVYAETGPNPRDESEDTSKGRGLDVNQCKKLLGEVRYRPREGPARSLQGPLRRE
jgi:biotin synthase